MKNNDFENEYQEYREIVDEFDAIDRTTDNDADLDAPRARMARFNKKISARGEDYARTFEEYKDARYDGNDYIDLHEVIRDEKVPALIERYRSFGIDRFTFSSAWSGAVETAWLFTENGCRLEGLIRINGSWDALDAGSAKKPAYLFSIQ